MKNRFLSLDIFRGATIAAMILVNNPGSDAVYKQLDHSPWNGCTFTDLIFPFFLFAVGNSIAFSQKKLASSSPTLFWTKVIKRTVLIFCIGMLVNWFPYIMRNGVGSFALIPFAKYRIFGVLQRIALCYGITAVLAKFMNNKGLIMVAAMLLIGYWALCYFTNPIDPFSFKGWFGTAIDKSIVGVSHMYMGEGVPFDPEGLMSLPAAIVVSIFGYIAGKYILIKGFSTKTIKIFLLTGIVLILVGYCWSFIFPINKKIWTSSYSLFTTGIAFIVLALLVYIVELKGHKNLLKRVFEPFGKNTLFIYILSMILPKIIWLIRIPYASTSAPKTHFLNLWDWTYRVIFSHLFTQQKIDNLLFAICFVLLLWSIAYIMDKRKVYIKI